VPTIDNSYFLQMTSYGMWPEADLTTTTVQAAYHLPTPVPPVPLTPETVNVALFLGRANDPTSLLESDWATRQSTLASLEASGTLWSTYGASATDFAAAIAQLQGMGLTVIDPSSPGGYITSAESRTIWVTLTPTDFQTLFGATPLQNGLLEDGGLYYWDGPLSLPTGLHEKVKGLWFDVANRYPGPAVQNLSTAQAYTPAAGPQSIGNTAPTAQAPYPGAIAQSFYNFPLTDPTISTATVALIEPGSGAWLPGGPSGPSFASLLKDYQAKAGVPQTGAYYAVELNGTTGSLPYDPTERSLDVGVVASAAPGSTIGLYAGSGVNNNAHSSVITAYQAAIWDRTNNPPVLSASYSTSAQSMPGSVFANAVSEIFVDAALRNITVLKADNDFGSSWGFANGLANQNASASSPYAVIVGGTSLNSYEWAALDETVSPLLDQATANSMDTLWTLVAGGLTVLPADVSQPKFTTFLEAAWNAFTLSGNSWYALNADRNPTLPQSLGAGDGGVDTTQAIPSYQSDYGYTPISANPGHATGRGAPDVAATAGGNMWYYTPNEYMDQYGPIEGTSAAAPLWASLIAQIDTIFKDQGLPNLGYMNDLLYTASAIAPASFNDIRYGNNKTSFYFDATSSLVNAQNQHVVLTNYGYETTEGYDLVTGLGTPNGTLLARALSAIATAQTDFASQPDIVDASGGGWHSGADQTVLVQTTIRDEGLARLTDGLYSLTFSANAADSYAWTARFAQQSLQSDFDPALVRLFDKQSHSGVDQASLYAGQSLSLSVDGNVASAYRAVLTSPFGFADFALGNNNGGLRLARPVAVAETANGADDQVAIVRVRQNGEDSLSVTFYRVDDLSGRIAGLDPGDEGYAAAAQARAYQLTSGGTSLNGPGYGNFGQAGLLHVNAGDLVAMRLTNNSSGQVYWAFSQANEKVDGHAIGHLWNYGLNTWGWEDTYGGGDRDYNDLVVGIDFTSAAGHGWLV